MNEHLTHIDVVVQKNPGCRNEAPDIETKHAVGVEQAQEYIDAVDLLDVGEVISLTVSNEHYETLDAVKEHLEEVRNHELYAPLSEKGKWVVVNIMDQRDVVMVDIQQYSEKDDKKVTSNYLDDVRTMGYEVSAFDPSMMEDSVRIWFDK